MTIPNNILQGQLKEAGINSLRFSINTHLVLLEFLMLHHIMVLKKLDKEDYGQTLGHGV